MTDLLSRLPSELSIPVFAEMRERTRQLRNRRNVEVRVVGADREGEPIELISLGDGPTRVLLIGAPHPNEPIGCIGIEWLIEQFVCNPELLRQTGCRWHFIKAIEPYALKQNEAWFREPDVASYLQHFYRPISSAQAEYSFPPTADAASAHKSAPENEAYQQALRIAQPDVLASMHNSEAADAFFFLSRDDAQLANRVSAQALANELKLNLLGEPGPDVREAPLAPGVFLLIEDAGALAEPRENLGVAVTTWLAGQPGNPPLFLVPEVPLFVSNDTSNGFPSMDACLDSVAAIAWNERLASLLNDRLETMEVDATDIELLYLGAIRESVPLSRKLLDTLPDLKSKEEPESFEAQVRAQVLLTLRPMAMARRLASMRAVRPELGELSFSARAVEQACARDLSEALDSRLLCGAFRPVSLRAAVATQLHAVLAAIEAASQKRVLDLHE
jgi:hypothetical protein